VILSCVYAVFIVTLGVVIYVSDVALRNGTPLAEVRMTKLTAYKTKSFDNEIPDALLELTV
jgi:hypothetical protein